MRPTIDGGLYCVLWEHHRIVVELFMHGGRYKDPHDRTLPARELFIINSKRFCWRAPLRAVLVQLFATCWEKLLQVFVFVYLCLGWVRVGFTASALVRNGLFWPFETLSLDLLGLQRPIGRTLGLRQGYFALGSVFCLCC